MKQPATCEHINPQALISICSFVGTEIQTLLLRQRRLELKEGILLILFQFQATLQLRRKRFPFWDIIRHKKKKPAIIACLSDSCTAVWCVDEMNFVFVYLNNITYRQTTWLLLQWKLSHLYSWIYWRFV